MNIFTKAAQTVPGRWHKGDFADGHGNFCAAGHLLLAAGFTEEDVASGKADDVSENYRDEFTFINSVVREFSNGTFEFIADFNDDGHTTEDDIVAVLEKASVRWDERV